MATLLSKFVGSNGNSTPKPKREPKEQEGPMPTFLPPSLPPYPPYVSFPPRQPPKKLFGLPPHPRSPRPSYDSSLELFDDEEDFFSAPKSPSELSDIEEAEVRHSVLLSRQIRELDADFTRMEEKIHRFPPSLSPLYIRYGEPVAVPIGCHKDTHESEYMLLTKVKKLATYLFILNSKFNSFDEMFLKFCSDVGDVHSLYERTDSVLPMDDETLKLYILCDGCFLLQYMLMYTTGRDKMPRSLVSYFDSNQNIINRDMMLLENQLPWVVIQTLISFRRDKVPVEEFIAKMARTLQVRKGKVDDKSFDWDGYTPPHLLGLLRFYKIGSKIVSSNEQNKRFSLINYCCYTNSEPPPSDGIRQLPKTINAMKTINPIELAEIGIKLTASKTTKFMDMGIKKGLFCNKIFMAPLLLDETRLCWLVNMAAFEVGMGTTSSSDTEKHAVCSYLVALAMLMDREEDVHELRSKGLIQGQLTNKEILHFFKGLVKHISGGPRYFHLMEEIEDYKLKRWMWIKVHKFLYKHYKTIAAVLSIIGVLVGIFKALFDLKNQQKKA